MPVNKTKILLVEDECIVARDIEHQLGQLGYEVIGQVRKGEDVLTFVQNVQPDLIVMDIQLAGAMDGIAAAQAVRTQWGIPVVFLTAFAAEETLARAKLTEPFGYIIKPFSERELRTVLEMALFKHQAEVKLQTATTQLQALARRVLQVQELERRRVAMELHDELGQSLTAIKINLQSQMRFGAQQSDHLNAENVRIVEDALQQVRRIALALRPSMLDDLGLAPALRWMTEQTASRSGFTAELHTEIAQARLLPDVETACFRIAQEALSNIVRHAQAQHVVVGVRRVDQSLVLSIQDDGVGFDVAAMSDRAKAGKSLGVLGMQERATLVGGVLAIQSTPGKGSALHFECPWRTSEPETA